MDLRKRDKVDYAHFFDTYKVVPLNRGADKKKQGKRRVKRAKMVVKAFIPILHKYHFEPSIYRLYGDVYMRDKQLPEIGDIGGPQADILSWKWILDFRKITQ